MEPETMQTDEDEDEEVSGSDEGEINNLKSHKKPYASRMVMSHRKHETCEVVET
jgi:hypothetical protein